MADSTQTTARLGIASLHALGLGNAEMQRILEADVSILQSETWYEWNTLKEYLSRHVSDAKRLVLLTTDRAKDRDRKAIENLLAKNTVQILCPQDAAYPWLLKNADAPSVLYVRGTLPNQPILAVVGTRKPTAYSSKILSRIVPALGSAGYAIGSGGAYGVDATAHQLALENDIPTVCVFGTGIDRAYPASHRSLFERIEAEGGCLVSHLPIGQSVEPYHFAQRNAVLAGLSVGTIVTEAPQESGALITARKATQYGREVFAFPGDIDRNESLGTNTLIAAGEALLVTSAEDIMQAIPTHTQPDKYNPYAPNNVYSEPKWNATREKIKKEVVQKNTPPKTTTNIPKEPLSPILAAIQSPKTLDELVTLLQASPSTLATELSLYEVEGRIMLDQAGRYTLL